MSSGLVAQMSHKGIQDVHLSIEPETSFWKKKYKRPAEWASETSAVGIPGFQLGKLYNQIIPKSGDLITEMSLAIDFNLLRHKDWQHEGFVSDNSPYFCPSMGNALLEQADLCCGQHCMDENTGLINELQHNFESDDQIDLDVMCLRSRDVEQLKKWSYYGNTLSQSNATTNYGHLRVYTTFKFFFTMALSQSLPIISIQFSDLILRLRTKMLQDLYQFPESCVSQQLDPFHNGSVKEANIMVNHVYVGAYERKLFLASNHTYLIRNWAVSDFHVKQEGLNRMLCRLDFAHPVSAMFWAVQKDEHVKNQDYFNFERTNGLGDHTITSAVIKFSGSERERPHGPEFFNKVMPSRHWPRTPGPGWYGYSFGQKANSWMPTGSANFSRFDGVTLDLTFPTVDADGNPFQRCNVFVMNSHFNQLKIQGGVLIRRYAR
jgi:hypothetical protein